MPRFIVDGVFIYDKLRPDFRAPFSDRKSAEEVALDLNTYPKIGKWAWCKGDWPDIFGFEYRQAVTILGEDYFA